MGIAFALLALLSWGFGDFLIQRGTRKFGGWVFLFYVEMFVVIVLLPFIFAQIPKAVSNIDNLLVFISAGVVFVFASIFDFESLKLGKISVMEPIYAFEIPVTALLAFAILGERLTLLQTGLILCSMLGIILISMRSSSAIKNIRLERGVLYASLATLGLGAANFILGFGARETSPLLINWFASLFIAIVVFAYLAVTGRKKEIWGGAAHRQKTYPQRCVRRWSRLGRVHI
jgi:drug/metabolite transporter (DMT)-like permease